MVAKTYVNLYTAGNVEKLSCEFSLSKRDNSNILCFENDTFFLQICLKDIVDMEDFNNFLNNKEKRIILHCTFDYKDNTYKGLRKLKMNENQITLSLGGVRLEFDPETKTNLSKILKELKTKFG